MLRTLSLLLSCVAVVVTANVVILLADDLGMEIELYGQSACKTPHLMSLANRGVVYDRAWTAVSSCSPSRASILTGLPPHQNGMYGLHQGYHNFQSFDNVRSLSKLLNDADIRTGIIGKKHVGPESVYPFDCEQTEENNSIMQVGRNITLMKEMIGTFLAVNDSRPFLLYVGFHDPHRCGHTHPEFGQFCEKFGNGKPGNGIIPDWTPVEYQSDQVHVPYFVQDTPIARDDLASQYTTISRLDQGVGLIMQELENAGFLNETLVLFSSDNGAPYPSGRTNVYEPGLQIPLIVSSPRHQHLWNTRSNDLATLLDITPTVLDWFNISYPTYKMFHNQNTVNLTGKSLLIDHSDKNATDPHHKYTYASHSLHEITMYYPMRSVRNSRFKLIQNLGYRMPFPIDQDFFISPVFQDILNRTINGDELPWYKTLEQYYYRPQWELFDLKIDFTEKNNMAGKQHYSRIFSAMKKKLYSWQEMTEDPWICSPGGVLQDAGKYALNHKCCSMYNEL
uniref:N-sulphoglucosamine sulphohydrolase-like n=3 Tax=Hirondellea gigas TaxID=1518452 RepID=A0A6A7G0F8_9CRUS